MSQLAIGDPAPWFVAPTSRRPNFHFNTVAGRYVVLCFVESLADPAVQAMAGVLARCGELFNDQKACIFFVTCDPQDAASGRLPAEAPGRRIILDYDRRISAMFGVWNEASGQYDRASLVLDHNLHLAEIIPMAPTEMHPARLMSMVGMLPPLGERGAALSSAPVLIVPRVFEPQFCRHLIDSFERDGGKEGVYVAPNPKTGTLEVVLDEGFKKRCDVGVSEPSLTDAITARLGRRLFPELRKAFQFEVAKIDQYFICRYDEGDYFRSHRDDATPETSDRLFALTINLNVEEYEGGNLRFLEHDSRTYRPPSGGVIAFSCSPLHEARPVTRGRRYCVVTFLYGRDGKGTDDRLGAGADRS